MNLYHNDDVQAATLAGRRWVSERDIPDPVGWADMRFASDSVTELLRARRRGDRSPSRVHPFPLPKGAGPSNREWCMADPLDEIEYRLAVGRVSEQIERALGSEVLMYRLRANGPGWRARGPSYGGAIRRAGVEGVFAAGGHSGVGALDIRNYFPSLRASVLESILAQSGATTRALEPLLLLLDGWNSTWGVTGIPVGPEGSGPLGNVGLVPVDHAIRPYVSTFYRATDDYSIVCAKPEFEDVRRRAGEAAHKLGLELNDDKTRYYETLADLPLNLFDPVVQRLSRSLDGSPAAALAEVRDVLLEEVSSASPAESRIRFCLRVLSARGDATALPLIKDKPDLMRASPKLFGEYVRSMVARKLIDVEWLVGVAAAKPCPHTAAFQYHLLLACNRLRLPKPLARPLQDFALTPGKWTPLRCAAVEAWAASECGLEARAVDAVLEVGDAVHRRAIILGLRHINGTNHRPRRLEQIRRSAPDVAPAVRWVGAGAPAIAA